LLLLHPTLLSNGGLNLANNHVANAPNLFGENESLQMSTGSLENSEHTDDNASGSHIRSEHVVEDPGTMAYGDSPRIAEDQGVGAASGPMLDLLDGVPTTLSPDPQQSVMPSPKAALGSALDLPSGACPATACQHLGVHSSKATMTSTPHPPRGTCPAARPFATGMVPAQNLPGGAYSAIDESPQHQRSAVHPLSSSTIVHAPSKPVTRLAQGIVQPRKFIDGTIP
jgi:hypothetical protein